MFQSNNLSLGSVEDKTIKLDWNAINSMLIALSIIALWGISLTILLSLDIFSTNILLVLFCILWQTFLYTGLFITAHDAMHGVAVPQHPKINNFIGTLTLLLYAQFSYKYLVKQHWLHHHHPASNLDPDFHDGQGKNFFVWYLNFLGTYFKWRQLIGLTVIFYLLCAINISVTNILLFWAIPPLLSSLQLFYFGTFLPHREPVGGYTNLHRAETNPLPVFWSFITCYHFGYHEEHHEYPHLPWWKLPEVYQAKQ